MWKEKVSPVREADYGGISGHMMRGILLEKPILAWYVHDTGRTVLDTGTLRHPEHPLIIATPDGVSIPTGEERLGGVYDAERDVVVEVKCPSWRSGKQWGEPGTDEIPAYYYPQVMWEMAVTGLKSTHVVAFLGDQPLIYNVPWRQDVFEALRGVAEDFWGRYVVTGRPPPPDASRAYTEHVAALHPSHGEDMVTDVPEETLRWLKVAYEAEGQMRKAAQDLELAKNNIKALIGDKRGIRGDFGTVSWSRSKDSRRTDWQAVAKSSMASDEAVSLHTTTKPGPRVFRANWSSSWER